MADRDVRLDGMCARLGAAVALREATMVKRACADLGPLLIKVCLGEGRCLLPAGSGPKVCAFCTEVPHAPGLHREVDAVAARIFKGN